MRLYAPRSWRLVRQVSADVFVAVWAVVWWFTGRAVDGAIRALALPAAATERTASDLRRQVTDAADGVGNLPGVGTGLRQPFDAIAGSLGQLAASASEQVTQINAVANTVGWVVFLIPAACLIAVWLPFRLRFAARVRDLRALAATPNGTDLLALRALTNSSVEALTAIAADPVAAWRAGDPDVVGRLAALELRRAGVRPRAMTSRTPS